MSEWRARPGALGAGCLHLCIDMQCMFPEGTDWHGPRMARVLPRVERRVAAHPARTILTRFVPARHPGEGRGTQADYHRRWASMTRDRLVPGLVDLVPELARHAPPAEILDKAVYASSLGTDLDARLRARGIDSPAVTGGETEICVLAAVLVAVDLGYRVFVVTEALCSSSDRAHDALMTLYHCRHDQQVHIVTSEDVLLAWT